METTRQNKVSKLIQKELSNIFQRETYEILGNILVTVTRVNTSPDLSVVKVYLSIFPANDPLLCLESINKKKVFFRKLLGMSCRHQLRIIPEIIFYLDDSAEYTEEINRLLNS